MDGNTSGQNGQQGTQGAGQQKPGLSWTQPSTPATNAQKNTQNAPQSAPQAKSHMTTMPQSPANQRNTKKSVGIAAGIVIVCALVIWGLTSLGHKGPQTQNGAVATSTNSGEGSEYDQSALGGTTVSAAGLDIPSPQNAGMQVAVTHVDAASPIWVVVYENHNGQPGNALGAALFTPERQSGVVDLLRGTLPGQTYFAGESRDDGDHIFSLDNDPALRDANGNPILLQFQTR